MRVLTMSWLLALTLFCLASTTNARATRKAQLPSATVVGTVYCRACLQDDFSKLNHFISGALVAVECDGTDSSPRFRKEVRTNRHGKFRVKLPFSVTKHVKNIKKCSVNLVRSNDANCTVALTATTSSLHLKSIRARTQIFSAGFLTFKPLITQPNLCNQKPQISNSPPTRPPKRATPRKTSKDLLNQKTFFPFPPLIPNPFQPPPAILPPIIPSPPPSIFPPLFPSPPPSIFPPIFPPPPQPPPSMFPPIFPAPPQPPPSIFPPIFPAPPVSPPFFPFPPLIPNPFQPPPAILPPIIPSPPPSIFPPLFPSPPPSIYPPIFPLPPQPPPSIFPPIFPAPPVSPPSFFPPIPGFTPPVVKPPPPPPVFPFLPPEFPGVPPAASSSHSMKGDKTSLIG